MKKLIAVLALVILCVCVPSSASAAPSSGSVSLNPPSPFRDGAFFGIWFGASKSLSEAQNLADGMAANGFVVQIFLTTDWNNLNTDPWYVLTAGMYASNSEAALMLPEVQRYYPDAYIKYSGLYQGTPDSFAGGNSPVSGEPGQSPSSSPEQRPFYGVWCGASKDRGEMQKLADTLSEKGFPAKVFLTTDWGNLNVEPWYVTSAGVYETQAAAENALALVQPLYPDAYVKYSGNWQGTGNSSQAYQQAEADTAADGFTPFYGIWCYASKSYGDAQEYAYTLQRRSWPAAIYVTTDWSNLNSEFWYVVSAGSYTAESSAMASLPQVQAICPDAYVKYSGIYQGQ